MKNSTIHLFKNNKKNYPSEGLNSDCKSLIIYFHTNMNKNEIILDKLQADELNLDLNKFITEHYLFSISPGNLLTSKRIIEIYESTLLNQIYRNKKVILIFCSEYSNDFTKAYYNFFTILRPYAVVLISSLATLKDLNNITCPYLLIEAQDDPNLCSEKFKQLRESVYHHQMRYGDGTTYLLKSKLKNLHLNNIEFRKDIFHWLKKISLHNPRPKYEFIDR